MRFLLHVIAATILVAISAAPAATQEEQAPVTVTPESGTTETIFTVSGDDCLAPDGSAHPIGANWSVKEGPDDVIDGTATPAPDGSWSDSFSGDMAGPGEYRVDAGCWSNVDYLSVRLVITEPANEPPAAPRMTG